MRNFKRAKMTGKARAAIETYADHYRIAPEDVRHDRPAIRGIYAELEANGYVWQASKQMWAYIPPAPQEKSTLMFSLSADESDYENAVYIIGEGLKAAGYDVLSQTLIVSMFDGGISTAIFEVKL